MPADTLPEPWRSFLGAIDAAAPRTITMHCTGGFAVTQHYELVRATGDIDVCQVIPADAGAWLASVAGEGTALHRRFRVHLQMTSVATLPEKYADRLVEVFIRKFAKLRMLVADPYDIALSKLERNSEVDIEDVKHLARVANFNRAVIEERYRSELRPFLLGPASRHDLTLALWCEAIAEERARSGRRGFRELE